MIDNDIIKGMECCVKSNCEECPFIKEYIGLCEDVEYFVKWIKRIYTREE